MFIDRVASAALGAPFVKDPESPTRMLPTVSVYFCVAKGAATIRVKDSPHAATAPPGNAVLTWTSAKGKNVEVVEMKELPAFVTLTPPAPDKEMKKISDEFLKAREDLSMVVGTKAIDVGLAENLTQKDPARAHHRRAVLCRARHAR